MSRTLVAGVGNIFLSDDGFGVEVVKELGQRTLPTGVELADFGIRGVHLAYQLMEGYDLLILVDAVPRDQPPGTLFVIEPETALCSTTKWCAAPPAMPGRSGTSSWTPTVPRATAERAAASNQPAIPQVLLARAVEAGVLPGPLAAATARPAIQESFTELCAARRRRRPERPREIMDHSAVLVARAVSTGYQRPGRGPGGVRRAVLDMPVPALPGTGPGAGPGGQRHAADPRDRGGGDRRR